MLVVPAHVRRSRRCIADGLRQRDAGLEPANEGDDVAPVARRAIEIERGDGVDLGAGRKHRAEVESCWAARR